MLLALKTTLLPVLNVVACKVSIIVVPRSWNSDQAQKIQLYTTFFRNGGLWLYTSFQGERDAVHEGSSFHASLSFKEA